MAQIQLTLVSSGAKFTVSDENIIKVATDTNGAMVQYITEQSGSRYQAIVSEDPALIASASANLISITDQETAQDYWINIDRISLVDESGTYVNFSYEAEGATPQKIYVTQTIAQFYTLVYEKQGSTVFSYDAVNTGADTISLTAATGDVTAQFTLGVVFTVFGSSTAAMNTIWTVTSSTFSGGKTVITVDGDVPTGASSTGELVTNG